MEGVYIGLYYVGGSWGFGSVFWGVGGFCCFLRFYGLRVVGVGCYCWGFGRFGMEDFGLGVLGNVFVMEMGWEIGSK